MIVEIKLGFYLFMWCVAFLLGILSLLELRKYKQGRCYAEIVTFLLSIEFLLVSLLTIVAFV